MMFMQFLIIRFEMRSNGNSLWVAVDPIKCDRTTYRLVDLHNAHGGLQAVGDVNHIPEPCKY